MDQLSVLVTAGLDKKKTINQIQVDLRAIASKFSINITGKVNVGKIDALNRLSDKMTSLIKKGQSLNKVLSTTDAANASLVAVANQEPKDDKDNSKSGANKRPNKVLNSLQSNVTNRVTNGLINSFIYNVTQVEEQMSKISRSTGGTLSNDFILKQVIALADKVKRDIPEVQTAMNGLVIQGFRGEDLSGLSEAVLTLSNVTDIEVPDSVTLLGGVIKEFEILPAKAMDIVDIVHMITKEFNVSASESTVSTSR